MPTAATCELYWTSESDPAWDQAKHISFDVQSGEVPGTGAVKWVIYEIPMGILSDSWRGIITHLRFDPTVSGKSGWVEVAYVGIAERPKIARTPTRTVKQGEWNAPVRTGIEPSGGMRFIHNNRFKVSGNGGPLAISRMLSNGDEVQDAVLTFEARTKAGEDFRLDDYPTDLAYCRFQDRWIEQRLVFNFEPGVGRDDLKFPICRLLVTMLPFEPPKFLFMGGYKMVTARLRLARSIRDVTIPGRGIYTASRGTAELPAVRLADNWVRLSSIGGPPIYLIFNGRCISRLRWSSREVSFTSKPGEPFWAFSSRLPLENMNRVCATRKMCSLASASPVTAKKGLSILYTTVNITFDAPQGIKPAKGVYLPLWITGGADGRIRFVKAADGKVTVKAPVAITNITSSNYIDVNVPVRVKALVIPSQGDTTRVYDAFTKAPLRCKRFGGKLIMASVPPSTIRVKYKRLLGYRVLFNAPRPIDGGPAYEEFSNYHYPQWVFLWDGWLNPDGSQNLERMDYLNALVKTQPLPVFMGFHYGNHGPPGSYNTFHKLHPDILQINNKGEAHKGLAGGFATPPWMCLVHPTLRSELETRMGLMFDHIRRQPFYSDVFGFGSTSEPWIVTEPDHTEIIYCYNPAHIAWFRDYEKRKWNDDLKAFNETFGTSYSSWDKVEPPRKAEDTAYFNEWKLAKIESVIASEEFYRGLIYKGDPTRPNFAHTAIMLEYGEMGVANTPDIMLAGKYDHPDKFFQGGSLYTNDPAQQAFIVDSIRSTDLNSACFPEFYCPTYGDSYKFLVGATSLFTSSMFMMIPGPSWDSGLKVGNGWQGFSEMMHFLAMDFGSPLKPDVALVFDPLSDNQGPMRKAHSALLLSQIDRCVITTRMIERGYLKARRPRALVIPSVKILSLAALREIDEAAGAGTKVFILGPFAETDYYLHEPEEFKSLREKVISKAVKPEGEEAMVREVKKLRINRVVVEPLAQALSYRKERGITILNSWAGREFRLQLPSDWKRRRTAVIADTGQVVEVHNPAGSISVFVPTNRAVAVKIGDL